MSQLSLDINFVRAPHESLRRIARAAKAHVLAAAVIGAIVTAVIALRVASMALANRELMQAFRETLRHIALAMGLPG